jgi:hypothetical protein
MELPLMTPVSASATRLGGVVQAAATPAYPYSWERLKFDAEVAIQAFHPDTNAPLEQVLHEAAVPLTALPWGREPNEFSTQGLDVNVALLEGSAPLPHFPNAALNVADREG